jgi:tetratricopeptide (TPR) repeat protein
MSQNGNLYIEASIFHDEETHEHITRFNTSAGRMTTPFKLFTPSGIDEELAALRDGITRSVVGKPLRAGPECNRPRAFGQKLFNYLFHGDALELYRTCRQRLEESAQIDQRLVIKINPTTYNLANLPWELLCDPERGFCAFDRRTPVIRFIPDRPARRLTFDPEWRILLIASNPTDTQLLDLRGEMQQIQKAFEEVAPHVVLKIENLLMPSPKEFRGALRDFDPHVLHFMGHGGAGHLLLEGYDKDTVTVREENLTATLQNIPSLRLIFLNACETAAAESEQNLGLAHALSRVGIPAVVANQFPAVDDAAREMSDEFYRVLASGLPVDEAVLWGRIAVQGFRGAVSSPTLEWATPVLYLQVPDGHLFKDLLQRQSSLPDHKYDVFISYSHADRGWVWGELLPRLEESELKVIIDDRDFEIGVPRLTNIERAVDDSRHTLIVLTPDWIESQWTEFESLLAGAADPAGRRRRLVPIVLKPCNLPSRISMLTYADFMRPEGREAQMGRLVKSLRPSTQSERARSLREQLNVHRRNLNRLTEQKAKWGPQNVLRDVLQQIKDEQASIDCLEEELAGLGEKVESELTPPQPGPLEVSKSDVETGVVSPDPKLQTLYRRAEKHFNHKEWDDAITLLEDVTRTWATFQEAQTLLQKARQERDKIRQQQLRDQRLTALLNAARVHWEAGQKGEKSEWQKALGLLDEILMEASDFAGGEASRLQSKVKAAYEEYLKDQRIRQRLETLYAAAQQAANTENWSEASPLLRSVLEDDPSYKDAAQLLQTVTRQAHLAALYNQGNLAYQGRNWAEAVEHFGNIQSLAEKYKDVSEKFADARQQLRWDKLYDEGLAYLEREDWDNAVEVLSQVEPDEGHRRGQLRDLAYARAMQAYTRAAKRAGQQADCPADWEIVINLLNPVVDESPGYRDAARIIQAARRQARWARLYEEGQQHVTTEDWVATIQTFEIIVRENPDYRDTPQQLQMVRRQQRLAQHYEKGHRYLAWESWRESRDEFQAIVDTDPNYLDAFHLLEQAEQEIRLAELYGQALQDYSANNRDAAIACLERIAAEKETYREGEARSLLEAWKKEKEIRRAYEEGKAYIERKQWRAAVEAFGRLFKIESQGYLDAGIELEKARLELRLEELYAEALHLISDQQWEKSITTLKEVQVLREDYRDVLALLKQSEEEHWLKNQYQQALQYQATEEWDKATAILEKIQRRRPGYADTDDLWKEVQHQQQLAESYAAARQAFEKEDWAKAVDWLQKIRACAAVDYKDAPMLYEHAERNRRLDELYKEANIALGKSDLEAAEAALSAAAGIDEGYRDVQVRLAQVRRQKRLLSLYDQAQEAFAAERWEEAIEAYRRVLDMDPGYVDAERRLKEAEYRKRLADFYAAAGQAMAEEDWEKAITHYEAIVSLDQDYRDAEAGLARAKQLQKIQELRKNAIRCESEGNLAEALEEYQAIFELDPNFDEIAAKVRELSRALELAQLYQKALEALEARRFAEGIPWLQQLLKRAPGYEDAQNRLQQAIQDHRSVLLEQYQYAQRLKKERRFKESRRELEAYQREIDNSPWLRRSN